MNNFMNLDFNQILARCMEYHQWQQATDGYYIGDQDDVMELFIPKFKHTSDFEYHGIYLDYHHRTIGTRLIGTEIILEKPVFDLNNAVLLALMFNTRAVIIVHNHPGPTAYPNPEEIKETKKLKTILKMLNICLIDHLIISSVQKYHYFSFANDDAGLTGFNEIL
jgi:DNA repair protein RadC